MINRLFILLIGIVFVGCADEVKTKKDLGEMNLYGKVKSIQEVFSSEIVEGSSLAGVEGYHNYFFNTHGSLVKEEYSYHKSRCWTERFKYDKNGSLVENVRLTKDGEYNIKTIYTYDNENNLTAEHYSYSEDEMGDLMEEYKYDSLGNLIEQISYSEYYYLDDDTTMKSKSIFQYNPEGNIISENIYNHDGSHRYLRESHYSNGLLTINNVKGGKISYKYDEFRNEIEEFSDFGVSGSSISKHIYTYDLMNNWTQNISSNEEITITYIREIEYYD